MSSSVPNKIGKRAVKGVDMYPTDSKCPKRRFVRMFADNSDDEKTNSSISPHAPDKVNVVDESLRLDGEMDFEYYLIHWDELTVKSQIEVTDALLARGKELAFSVEKVLESTKNLFSEAHEKKYSGVYIVNDISGGKEKIKIPAINEVDDGTPPELIYMEKIEYPKWLPTISEGCNCISGCSDTKQCLCVHKNGGEIPFNDKGAILYTMDLVHECGPKCKCPPTCLNRVSQHGIRFQLELFKTESKGWGVRSHDYIPRGSFICEYVGEILNDKEADKRVGSDEYLFDITVFEESDDSKEEIDDDGGFSIDGAIRGNVGRYVNHSCDPNVYTQEVLYDHDDKRIPHIMFFAFKAIRPMQELAYDYGYKDVRDEDGNVRMKDCFCGARKCKGRMY